MKYKQCRLKRGTRYITYTTAWIPVKFAQTGRGASLKNDDGTWEHDWVIVAVWDYVTDDPHPRVWKHHRRETDT